MLLRAVASSAAVALLAAACSGGGSGRTRIDDDVHGAHRGLGAGAQPNVLFVLTDDMRLDDLQYLPQIQQLVGEQGMTFDNEFDNVTLCCPARTSILRGQYSHNTGVLTNGGTNGGFETAHAEDLEQSTVATAMHDAGYTTGLFGKYLNGYPNTVESELRAARLGHLVELVEGERLRRVQLHVEPERHSRSTTATSPSDYGTDVYSRQATDFIDQARRRGQAVLRLSRRLRAAPTGHTRSAGRTGLPRPAGTTRSLLRRSRRQRQTAVHPEPAADEPCSRRRRVDALARRRAQSLQAVDRDVAGLVDASRPDR